jgi:ABC-type Fe3+ transport system substrate-binding protein
MLGPSNYWTDLALIQKGAPLQDAVPSPNPTTGAEEWFALPKNAPHPNAALLFFNYAMSVAGQFATCNALCQSVRHTKGTLPFPKDYESPPINPAVQNKKKILGLLNLA